MIENRQTEGQSQGFGANNSIGPHDQMDASMESEKDSAAQDGGDEVDALVKLTRDLESERLQSKENFDKFLRVSADFENLRKRTERERQDLLRYGNEKLLNELLPVVDSFHKAVGISDGDLVSHTESKVFREGIGLILRQLTEVLERNGLKVISSQGAPFDPNVHQAIQKIECDQTDVETVHEEYVKGYLLHDRLLRPAMVSVKVPAASKDQ